MVFSALGKYYAQFVKKYKSNINIFVYIYFVAETGVIKYETKQTLVSAIAAISHSKPSDFNLIKK